MDLHLLGWNARWRDLSPPYAQDNVLDAAMGEPSRCRAMHSPRQLGRAKTRAFQRGDLATSSSQDATARAAVTPSSVPKQNTVYSKGIRD